MKRRQIMKSRLKLALMALSVAAVGATIPCGQPARAQVGQGSTFIPLERDFSVLFPAPPQIDGHAPTSDDDSGFRTYLVQDQYGSYLVRIDQYPKSIPVPDPNPRAYRLLLRAHAVQSSSRLISVTEVKVGGLAALQGDFVSDTGGAEQMLVLMVGHRVYQVSRIVRSDAPAAAAPDPFLESFRIAAR